jgi:PAS domain S-box-containing protein
VLVAVPEGLFVFDREGRIVFANPQFEELFGYAPGELLGQSSELLIPDLFEGECERQSAGAVPARPTPRLGLKAKGYRKDRGEILLQVSLGSVEDLDSPLQCCIAREFASLEQHDHTLGGLNDHFRQMVENSHDILSIRDADTRVRYASPSFQHVMGYKQEEIIGSTGFDLIHPEDRTAVENAVTEFWKTPEREIPSSTAPNTPMAHGSLSKSWPTIFWIIRSSRVWLSTAATSVIANTRKTVRIS